VRADAGRTVFGKQVDPFAVVIVVSLLLAVCAMAPRAEAISVRQLVEVADFGPPAISPDGILVAFRLELPSIERNTHDTAWYVQRMDGDVPPRRVAEGGVPLRDSAGVVVPAAAVWSADARWIYFLALQRGKVDVWRAATDGSGAEPLTDDPADVRGFVLSDDGSLLKYRVGATREQLVAAEESERERGIRVDHRTPIGQALFRSGYIEGRHATQRLGSWFNREALLADVPDQWHALDLRTGVRSALPPEEIPKAPVDTDGLGPGLPEPWKLAGEGGSGRLAMLTRTGSAAGLRDKPDVELAMLVDKDARTPLHCTAAGCTRKNITDIQWRPGSDEVLFTVTDYSAGHAQSIHVWNVRTGLVRVVASSGGGMNGGGRWATGLCGASSLALACIATEADRPPRLERLDLQTGERRVLFEPNATLAADIEASVPARLLRWEDPDGRVFTGQFFPALASGDGPPPLFVTYYNCAGFLRGGSGDEWPLTALASKGISSLCINALPFRMDAIERYDAGRSAVESVIQLLAAEGAINPRKVGMGGLSFGAETALWTAMHSDLLAAVSVATPVISQQYYLIGSNRGDAFHESLRTNWQLAGLEETPERWHALAPAFNLDRIRAPVLMQMPEQEFLQSLDYAVPLMQDGRADVYVFPYAPHIKFLPRHKLAAYERNLDWFVFWLLGHEDTTPTKAGRYAFWRAMQRAH